MFFKNRWRHAILPILLVIGFCVAPVEASTGSFHVADYSISVLLDEDGRSHVTERIQLETLTELRRLSMLYQTGDQQMTIEKIRLIDQSGQETGGQELELLPATVPGQAMTYTLDVSSKKKQLDLTLALQAGMQRTLVLDYSLDHAVLQHVDTAAFEGRFFDPLQATGLIDQATVHISCTAGCDLSQAWHHAASLSPFVLAQADASTLTFRAQRLPAAHTLTLTLLLPADAFSNASHADPMKRAATLQARAVHEERLALRLHQVRQAATQIILICVALAALIACLLYWLFDREGAFPEPKAPAADPPKACPPYLLALLMRHFKPAHLMLSLLLDLTERGRLSLDGTVFTLCQQPDPPTEPVSQTEAYLLDWFFQELSTDGSLGIADVRRYARHRETAAAFRNRYRIFQHLLTHELSEQNLIDPDKTRRGQRATRLLALCYVLLSLVFFLVFKITLALVLFAVGVGFWVYSLTIRRLTPHGRRQLKDGRALVGKLRHLDRQQPPPDADQQRAYFAYAVAFGLSQRFFNQLRTLWQDTPLHDQWCRYGLCPPDRHTRWQAVDQFQADITAMLNILTSSLLLPEMMHRELLR